MSFPRIETSRLLMRPFEMNDVDDLHRIWIDPGVRKFLWDDQIIPRETAIEVIEGSIDNFAKHGFGFWVIRFKNDPALVGFGGLRCFVEDGSEESNIELLYGVAFEHWGRGVATEAARAFLRYGFEEIGLKRIYAGADPPNAASFRVIEKLGMRFARRTAVNGLEAIYYVMDREDYKVDGSAYLLRRDIADRD
jgi:ribosomal-protein-alanine N-acetyltransferase